MPILVVAVLALAVFGLIAILLLIAMILEHSLITQAAKTDPSYSVTTRTVISLNPNFDRPRGEDTPTDNPSPEKEKVHEHALVG